MQGGTHFVRKIGHEANAKIISMYKEGVRTEEIAKKLDIHPHTVRDRINKYENMVKERVEAVQEEELEDVIVQLKGHKPKSIVKKILNILDVEENLRMEFMERGADSLNRVLGTIMDKAIKLYEIDKQKQMHDEMETAQDNFYNAMSDAITKLVDVDTLIDEESKTKEED